MSFSLDFSDKSVVVTGGAQGIGFEMTKAFLELGANVSIWDFNVETMELAQKELSSFAKQLKICHVDVTNSRICNDAAMKTGMVDILVNNAGITKDRSLAKMSHDDFTKVIDTNLTGLFNVTKSILDQKLFNQSSAQNRIINMASVVGIYGNFGQTNYAAAKAGVIGMTKTWAKELGRKGFTSNAIAPGFVETKMTSAMPEDVLKAITDKVPVNRMGRVEDISNTCLFLASDKASYINGAVISVDGGITL